MYNHFPSSHLLSNPDPENQLKNINVHYKVSSAYVYI